MLEFFIGAVLPELVAAQELLQHPQRKANCQNIRADCGQVCDV
jgi:hypothetical protein